MNNIDYIKELKRLYLEAGEAEEDIECAAVYAKHLLSLDLPVIMSKKHFAAIIGLDNTTLVYMTRAIENTFYHSVSIPKKSGGTRELLVPAKSLKFIQQWILKNILQKIPVSRYATGFCIGKSIVTNAECHVGNTCVLSMDMKDFFPSITQKQIYRIFYYYGYTDEVSHLLSRLCTCNGKLPQGAPTSPYLSNIVCLKLDKRLSGLSSKYNASYSRYADDITISANGNIKRIIPIVTSIIQDEGFHVNEKKTRIAYDHQRQEVTGLIINNGRISVPKKYRKKLLQEIYYCQKYGVQDHLNHIGCTKMFYQDHMYGKAYFMYMVDKSLGKKVLELLDSIDWGNE